jgi:hypothetical protein
MEKLRTDVFKMTVWVVDFQDQPPRMIRNNLDPVFWGRNIKPSQPNTLNSGQIVPVVTCQQISIHQELSIF